MDGGTEEKRNRDSEDVKEKEEELKDNVKSRRAGWGAPFSEFRVSLVPR